MFEGMPPRGRLGRVLRWLEQREALEGFSSSFLESRLISARLLWETPNASPGHIHRVRADSGRGRGLHLGDGRELLTFDQSFRISRAVRVELHHRVEGRCLSDGKIPRH